MSSTLFGRGTNTQVGLRQRAEEVNKRITDLRTAADIVKDLPLEFRVMRTRVEALETRNSTFEVLTAQLNELVATVDILQNKVTYISEKNVAIETHNSTNDVLTSQVADLLATVDTLQKKVADISEKSKESTATLEIVEN